MKEIIQVILINHIIFSLTSTFTATLNILILIASINEALTSIRKSDPKISNERNIIQNNLLRLSSPFL
ncbi:hypothetical protein [Companilactobacillus mishanensis]|uniref:hypothetical protein n=1 Tax=Companilactobacillus mishanensis TaxID=2486008 RepID=UPI0012D584A6|nr:hypothetical protein [Companilactobacillus mishanensis]MQS89327.1 hypothetical protein [Companilactobacillus mishanensis]